MTTALARPSRVRVRMTDEQGVRFGIANVVLTAALFASAVSGSGRVGSAGVLLLVACLASRGLPAWMRVVVAIGGWAMLTGFVVHAYGVLTFAPADLVRLALFLVATLVLPLLLPSTAPHRPSGAAH